MSDLSGPRQVVLITARAEIEEFGGKNVKEDVEPAFWHMPLSNEERMYAVAIHNNKNATWLIKNSGVFVINFLPLGMGNKVEECTAYSEKNKDKFENLELQKEDADAIECPRLKDACAYLECQVFETRQYSDYTLFIAKIINSNAKYRSKRLFHLRDKEYTTTREE